MIVDTSALIAILFNEPERRRLLTSIELVRHSYMSAANVLEAHMVVGKRRAPDEVDLLLSELRIAVREVTLDHLTLARAAHDRFGRGNHPAKLNFGDCFAYALAKATKLPLLFKGNDFGQTDVSIALY